MAACSGVFEELDEDAVVWFANFLFGDTDRSTADVGSTADEEEEDAEAGVDTEVLLELVDVSSVRSRLVLIVDSASSVLSLLALRLRDTGIDSERVAGMLMIVCVCLLT